MSQYSFVGKGSVYLAPYGEEALRPIGNCDKVNISFEEETLELKDYTRAGGGLYNTVSRIAKAQLSLNLFDFSPENIALASFGRNKEDLNGKVSDEAHTVTKGSVMPLAHPFVSNVKLKQKDYVSGKDYIVQKSSILIPQDSTIPNGKEINISYDYARKDMIELMITSGKAFRIYFEGLNEARSNRGSTLEIYKAKFNPASSIDLIGSEFGAIELTANVLSDRTKLGDNISTFMKMNIEA